jgi:hypothetical protein
MSVGTPFARDTSYNFVVFSVKLVARPDPRMVEVPLEIEAELPREFDGAALLASSGLPRKVKLKAPKDALKLSTAYRADQLLADIVRSALRGTVSDVQRVQEAATRFIRTVRERRQDGATLTVTTNGRGKVEVTESIPPLRSAAPMITPPELPRTAEAPKASAAFDRRLGDLEAAVARVAVDSELSERVKQLEARLTQLSVQLVHLTAVTGLAGPGMEHRPGSPRAAQREGTPRRATAVDAYAAGLRTELIARGEAAVARGRKESERADKAAALAAEATQLGAPRDGTAERLWEISAQGGARLSALQRLLEETDLYAPADLPIAQQLMTRLEDVPAAPEVAVSLEPVAQAVVRAALGADAEERTAWLTRTAALCGWQLVAPEPGSAFDAEWQQAVDGGGPKLTAVACPGLRRMDGSGIVRARVTTAGPAEPVAEPAAQPVIEPMATKMAEPAQVPLDLGLPPAPEAPPVRAETGSEAVANDAAVDAAQISLDLRSAAPAPAELRGDTAEMAPLVLPSGPHPASNAIPLPAPTKSSIDPNAAPPSPYGGLSGGDEIRPEEAAAAARSAVLLRPRIVTEDGARGDLGLTTEVAKTGPDETNEPAQPEHITDDDVEEIEDLSEPLADDEPEAT